jgi:hypothetical protein
MRVPGKAVEGGAHPNDGAAWRRWRSLGTAAFIDGERAPVVGGEWDGLIVKLRRRWRSDENWREEGSSVAGASEADM